MDVVLWDYYHHEKYKRLEGNLDDTLEQARMIDTQPILLADKVGAFYQQTAILHACVCVCALLGCSVWGVSVQGRSCTG